MLLFTFELKYTRIFNTTEVTPFHVLCFPCYNGMTSLWVAQGDGFGVQNVALSVSIKQLRRADIWWPFGIWLG